MVKMIRQTLFLSVSHFAVRAAGFLIRIWLSRELGAQAMGIVELAQSAQMLLITPVVSGLPASISRMCAQSSEDRQRRILRCGVALSLAVSVPLMIAAFCLRVPLANWLGSLKTLPSLVIYLPCIPILGVSCALNGYYYGTGRPVPPALSELLEQGVRLLLCMRLIPALRGWPVTLRAAVPALGLLCGEAAGLALMLIAAAGLFLPMRRGPAGERRSILREMLALSLPLTGMRLVSALMRTANSVLIPLRLTVSGLPHGEAVSLLGMMNGMLMPILTLPSFVTCSLSTIASPELARRQAAGAPLRRLSLKILVFTLLVSMPVTMAVRLLSPVIAHRLYRQAELLPLLNTCCPLIIVLALGHVSSSMLSGLGLQSQSLRISLAAGMLSLMTSYALAANPSVRLWGAIAGMAAGQLLTLAMNLTILRREIRRHDSRLNAAP
ncbi:MAG: oligosaccharide flippase family protein [Clostridia bacterium]|nr:oligosaccharide flippase family protein [Clostridia bacterium]